MFSMTVGPGEIIQMTGDLYGSTWTIDPRPVSCQLNVPLYYRHIPIEGWASIFLFANLIGTWLILRWKK